MSKKCAESLRPPLSLTAPPTPQRSIDLTGRQDRVRRKRAAGVDISDAVQFDVTTKSICRKEKNETIVSLICSGYSILAVVLSLMVHAFTRELTITAMNEVYLRSSSCNIYSY